MFDYIEMRKDMSGEDFNGVNLSKYLYFDGRGNTMKAYYNKEEQILTVKGSMPYYIQGHNFFFDLNEAYKVINDISLKLGTDMYDAEVKIMEYGVVVCSEFSIVDFIDAHVATRGYYEDVYLGRGKNYVKKDGAYKLKFYSIWANIDNNRCKIDSTTRKMLLDSDYGRRYEPMRYEIHGNPKKIFNSKQTYYVSDVLTVEFEEQCRDVLLKKYIKIKKAERVVVKNMERLDVLKLAIARLSECDNRYQENLLRAIDKTGAKPHSKYARKTDLRKKFRQLPREKCSYSIEDLIVEEFERQKQKNQT